MNLEEKRKKILEVFKELLDNPFSKQKKLDKTTVSKKGVLIKEKPKHMKKISRIKLNELREIALKLDETTIDKILNAISKNNCFFLLAFPSVICPSSNFFQIEKDLFFF